MKAEELARLMKAGQAPVILDVRSGFEYQAGHIAGAIHAPLPGTLQALQAVQPGRDSLVVILCEHGPRAQLARVFLKLRGYRKIELLEGHMAGWRQAGRPMKKGS